MRKKNKRMEAVNLKVDSNLDADDFGQRIAECVRCLNPDIGVVNLVKVDLGKTAMPAYNLGAFMKNLKEMFESVNARNCVFVPVGEAVGVKDISIEYVKVVTDDTNERTASEAD